jgi:glutaconate CoA-transferase, subunit B
MASGTYSAIGSTIRLLPPSEALAVPHAESYTSQELLISVIAGLLAGCRHVVVGTASPIPGAGALLARSRCDGVMRVSLLGSIKNNFFTDGGAELFDCAAQGRVDAFFLSGGQIDGQANINLVGTSSYPKSEVRWPGSFGSAHLYFLVPRVILFREEHTRRVMVEKVDFVSAPGTSEEGVYRQGGPHALLTSLALFDFQKRQRRFRLNSVHPGRSLEEVQDNTGFAFDLPEQVPTTREPDVATLSNIRSGIRSQIAEVYPRFAASAFLAGA